MEQFHHNGEIPSSKSVTQMMEFLQVKSPFIGVMCNPTVAIATNYGYTRNIIRRHHPAKNLELLLLISAAESVLHRN